VSHVLRPRPTSQAATSTQARFMRRPVSTERYLRAVVTAIRRRVCAWCHPNIPPARSAISAPLPRPATFTRTWLIEAAQLPLPPRIARLSRWLFTECKDFRGRVRPLVRGTYSMPRYSRRSGCFFAANTFPYRDLMTGAGLTTTPVAVIASRPAVSAEPWRLRIGVPTADLRRDIS
jgi:hypothetical protein